MGHVKSCISIKLKPFLSLISWKCLGTTYAIKGKLGTRNETVLFEKCQNKTFECFCRIISLFFSKANHWAKWSEIHYTFQSDRICIFHEKKKDRDSGKENKFLSWCIQSKGETRADAMPHRSSFSPSPAALTLVSHSTNQISLINFNRAPSWSKQPSHSHVFLTHKEMWSIPLLRASASFSNSSLAKPRFV